jgi:high-affinity iron transporter
VGWLGYLAAVLPTFVVTGRQARPAAGAVPTAPATPEVPAQPAAAPSPAPVAASTAALPWWQRRRGLAVAAFAALLVVPAAVAGGLVAVRPAAASAQTVQVTARACAPGWTTARTGQQTFSVTNASGRVAEVNLVQASTGGVVAEIETLGPGVTVPLSATLADAAYQWRCLLSGAPLRSSATVTATGAAVHRTVTAVVPVTRAQLRPATVRYRGYVERRLSSLSRQVTALHAALAGGSLARSRADWLRAQLTWESIGAAYGSFGSLGAQVDGLPFGLPRGVHDPAFTGLHRIEWALWHGRAPRPLARLTGGIRRAVAQIATRLPALTADPTDLPVRAHEILEDAERDHLSGFDDLGSGAAYAETHADVAATRVALRELAPQLQARVPGLLPAARSRLAALDAALAAARVHGGWPRLPAVPTRQRARVDAATGAALEVLDRVPDVLEVPAH